MTASSDSALGRLDTSYVVQPGDAIPLDRVATEDGIGVTISQLVAAGYDGGVNVKSLGVKLDNTTDDSVALQAAFDLGVDLFFPDGVCRCADVVIREQINITTSLGTSFKPIGAGTFVLKIDGSINPTEEDSIRVNINRLKIDGGSRTFAFDGLHIANLLRSTIGEIIIERMAGVAVDFVHNVKEVAIGVIQTIDCGSTTSLNVYEAVVDMTESGTTGDTHNNIYINNLYCVYSRGPDFVIDGVSGASSNPRKIIVNNYMIHGHIEASDPVGNPLSTAEKDDRRQIIIGSCGDVSFGVGSVQFAALATHAIHIVVGSNGDTDKKITFDNLAMNDRYDFAGAATQGTGIQQDDGALFIKGIDIGTGYLGNDSINSATGSDCVIDPFNFSSATGTITVTDTQLLSLRNIDIDVGSGDLNSVRTIKTGAASLEFIEGQSGSSHKAFEIKDSTNAVMGRAIATNFLEQGSITLPSAANMILDSVPAALAFDGTNLRWFDGTTWKTVTVV